MEKDKKLKHTIKGKEEKQKIRGKTFIRTETELLLKLVKKYYKVVENKTTDAITWKEKQRCWVKITDEFNSAGLYENRTFLQLHNKWTQLKKNARREYAAEKNALKATGGGEYKPFTISEYSQMVHELGAETIEGGTNPFDCDAIDDEPLPSCSGEPQPSPQPVDDEELHDQDSDKEMQELLNLEHVDVEFVAEIDEENNENVATNSQNRWITYKPSSLRSTKHPALTTTSSGKSRYTNIKGVVKNHAEMVQAKKEVIAVQREYFKKLLDIQVLEEKIKVEQHEWAREEHKGRMKILKAELEQTTHIQNFKFD